MITKEERAGLRNDAEYRDPISCDLVLEVCDALDAADEREEAWRLRLAAADARIAELEAAAQWRPIEEAPKDGKDRFIVARAGTQLRGPAYWCDGRWCQGVHEEPLHFTPTHFCELPDVPALPEGGV